MTRSTLALLVAALLTQATQTLTVRAQDAPITPSVSYGSVPTWIDIPRLGAHAAVVALAEEEDGTMQAPSDPDTVGWYQLGSGLGVPGNALLDGHVDWGGRLRVFGRLNSLEAGDRIQLIDASGNVLQYAVTWTKFVDANSAPLEEIFGQGPTEEITLITCGGEFDPAIHMYLSRWVVRAVREPTATFLESRSTQTDG